MNRSLDMYETFLGSAKKVAEEIEVLLQREEMQAPVEEAKEESKTKWICPLCKYEHYGETPPEKCPLCGLPGSKFIKG